MYLTKDQLEDSINYNASSGELLTFSSATFQKAERLSSEKIIASLFQAGQSFLYAPLRIIHQSNKEISEFPAQVAIAVSKKNFKNANDRNKVKRLIREAYRKNKLPLYNFLHKNNLHIELIFIYTAKKITTFNEIENKMKLALNRLMLEYETSK